MSDTNRRIDVVPYRRRPAETDPPLLSPEYTSTVPSSFRLRNVPYADGGRVSLSTSSRSAAMCSRASRSV